MTSLAYIDFIPKDNITQPQAAITAQRPPSVVELDAIELPHHGLFDPKSDQYAPPTENETGPLTPPLDGVNTPKAPDELEESRPPTPKRDEARGIIPSWSYPKMNKWRHLTACLEYFGNGLNDAAPGALIPYIESWYDIGYAVVSLIWVSNAIGFILAAFCAEYIDSKFRRSKSLMLSEVSIIIGYVIVACPVPFPVVVVSYLFMGFGQALNIALNNVWCSNLANSTVVLGAAHGSYGVGGIVGPVLATALVSNGINWHRFYAIPM